MDHDTKKFLIVALIIGFICYAYIDSRQRRDAKQQVIGAVRQFCSTRGGIAQELTDDIEHDRGLFTFICKDESTAMGSYKYPDQISFLDVNGNHIK